tara:strand:+ start:248 stop:1924 length:1677 start_codon:yes stop_codon:yes gene_type:complete
MNWDSAINKHFKNKPSKMNFDLLIEMVEEVMSGDINLLSEKKKGSAGKRAYNFVLGQFNAPTEQAGKMGTDERQVFQRYISKNIKGKTLAEKIESINAVATGEVDKDAPMSEILSSLGALKMLQQTLDDFNESTAGFLFEAFLSALLQGTQVTERVGGTLPIEDCMFFVDPKTGNAGQPVSLKLLSTTTLIEGSIVNLLGFFRRPDIAAVANEKGIEYIVATKTKGSRLDIFSFNITPKNFFHWIHEKDFDFSAIDFGDNASAEQVLPEALDRSEVNKKNANIWMKNIRQYRFAMMGIDRSSDFNLNWKKITDWRRAVPTVRVGAKAATSTAEIVISDAGRKSFESFKKRKFGVDVDILKGLEVPEEMVSQFLQDEDAAAKQAAAKGIALIGKARKAAYLNTIAPWGSDQPESAGHIQRYWADLNPKSGEMKSSDVQQRLNQLIDEGPEGIIKWATLLEQARAASGKTQFDIKPVAVRGYSTLYGTVNIDKRAVMRSLNMYGERLEQLCIPIYETMQSLTDHINGFYFENKPGSAFRASNDSVVLKQHTDNLVKETEK